MSICVNSASARVAALLRRAAPRLLFGLSLALAGCATVNSDPGSRGEPGRKLTVSSENSLSAVSTQAAGADTVPLLSLPLLKAAVTVPVGPEGFPDLATLEEAYRTTLDLAGDDEYDQAEDYLFILQDQTTVPLPAAADSAYVAQRRSLERRTVLLRAVLAEQSAFAHPSSGADSALTESYAQLQRAGFPDSLVPATGVTLSPITADLMKIDNQAVRRWEEYFTGRGRRSFQTWLDRKAEADSLMTGILTQAGLPPQLIYLAMIESGFSPKAVSSASAVGPWQFMAGTARDYDLRRNWWVDERRDPEFSTRAAARYLSDLYGRFDDWALVLAAYNTGGGRIARKIRQHGHDNFWDMRLPEQTTAHIPKFIAAARLGENPAKYGFTVPETKRLSYDIVPVDDATDLGLIARCAGVETSVVQALNPALLRGASPPDVKDYPVRVPAGTGIKAKRALAKVPLDKRLTWRRHKVSRGETLGGIARSYGASVRDVQHLNKLQNANRIHPGDELLIPMPAELAGKARRRAAEKGHYVPPKGYARVSYKVRSGDTLGGIARKLGVSLTHLRKVNNIHHTSLIRPGQRIYAYRPAG